eukprot:g2032.t1
MLLLSWNAAGWSGVHYDICKRYGSLKAYLDHLDVDVLCIQETKARHRDLSESLNYYGQTCPGFDSYWSCFQPNNSMRGSNSAGGRTTTQQDSKASLPLSQTSNVSIQGKRKRSLKVKGGYAGVAIWVRSGNTLAACDRFLLLDPKTQTLIVDHEFDCEGRFLVVETRTFFIFNVYVPNGSSPYKKQFLYKLRQTMAACSMASQSKKGTVLCGDLNLVYRCRDVPFEKRTIRMQQLWHFCFNTIEPDQGNDKTKEGQEHNDNKNQSQSQPNPFLHNQPNPFPQSQPNPLTQNQPNPLPENQSKLQEQHPTLKQQNLNPFISHLRKKLSKYIWNLMWQILTNIEFVMVKGTQQQGGSSSSSNGTMAASSLGQGAGGGAIIDCSNGKAREKAGFEFDARKNDSYRVISKFPEKTFRLGSKCDSLGDARDRWSKDIVQKREEEKNTTPPIDKAAYVDGRKWSGIHLSQSDFHDLVKAAFELASYRRQAESANATEIRKKVETTSKEAGTPNVTRGDSPFSDSSVTTVVSSQQVVQFTYEEIAFIDRKFSVLHPRKAFYANWFVQLLKGWRQKSKIGSSSTSNELSLPPLIDTFVDKHPFAREVFSCFCWADNSRWKNLGSRIDYILVDQDSFRNETTTSHFQRNDKKITMGRPKLKLNTETGLERTLQRLQSAEYNLLYNPVNRQTIDRPPGSISEVACKESFSIGNIPRVSYQALRKHALTLITANGLWQGAALDGSGMINANQRVYDIHLDRRSTYSGGHQNDFPPRIIYNMPPKWSDHLATTCRIPETFREVTVPKRLKECAVLGKAARTRSTQPYKRQLRIQGFFNKTKTKKRIPFVQVEEGEERKINEGNDNEKDYPNESNRTTNQHGNKEIENQEDNNGLTTKRAAAPQQVKPVRLRNGSSNSKSQSTVALIDMDCFYCAVERRLNPKLIGKPLAVVQYNPLLVGGVADCPARETHKRWLNWTSMQKKKNELSTNHGNSVKISTSDRHVSSSAPGDGRGNGSEKTKKLLRPKNPDMMNTCNGSIIAVSYEARAAGVTRSMRGLEASKVCPTLQFVQVPTRGGKADISLYRDAGASVIDACQRELRSLQNWEYLLEVDNINEQQQNCGNDDEKDKKKQQRKTTQKRKKNRDDLFVIERASVDEVYIDVTALCDHLLRNGKIPRLRRCFDEPSSYTSSLGTRDDHSPSASTSTNFTSYEVEEYDCKTFLSVDEFLKEASSNTHVAAVDNSDQKDIRVSAKDVRRGHRDQIIEEERYKNDNDDATRVIRERDTIDVVDKGQQCLRTTQETNQGYATQQWWRNACTLLTERSNDDVMNARYIGIGAAIIGRIRSFIHKYLEPFTCSAGIATTKTLAKLACGLHKPKQQTLVPKENISRLLENLPIGRLRGLGGQLGERLAKELGRITTVGELRRACEIPGRVERALRDIHGTNNISFGDDYVDLAKRIRGLCTTGQSLDGGDEVGSGKQFPKGLRLTPESLVRWVDSMCRDIERRLNHELRHNKRKATNLTVSVSLDGHGLSKVLNILYPIEIEILKKRVSKTIHQILASHDEGLSSMSSSSRASGNTNTTGAVRRAQKLSPQRNASAKIMNRVRYLSIVAGKFQSGKHIMGNQQRISFAKAPLKTKTEVQTKEKVTTQKSTIIKGGPNKKDETNGLPQRTNCEPGMAKCQRCGLKLLRTELQSHMDFHMAQDLQSKETRIATSVGESLNRLEKKKDGRNIMGKSSKSTKGKKRKGDSTGKNQINKYFISNSSQRKKKKKKCV